MVSETNIYTIIPKLLVPNNRACCVEFHKCTAPIFIEVKDYFIEDTFKMLETGTK